MGVVSIFVFSTGVLILQQLLIIGEKPVLTVYHSKSNRCGDTNRYLVAFYAYLIRQLFLGHPCV